MKKLAFLLFTSLSFLNYLFGTTTSSTTRNVSIDGSISANAPNGLNNTAWESDEEYLANDGTKFYLTWDNVNLYVAWKGGLSGHQRILWIDTDPKATPKTGTGKDSLSPYGGVNAIIPFNANFFVNFESSTVDRSYKYNVDSSKWLKVSNNAFTRTISGDGTEYEAKIPWDSLGGRPNKIYFLSYINEKSGSMFVSGNTDGYVYGGAPTTVMSGDFDDNNFVMTINTLNTWFAANITSGISPFSNQGGILTSVAANTGVTPNAFGLDQNYPNPFNPATIISYQLPSNNHVSLKVYDMIGREVATLVNEVKGTGSYEVMFDASKLSSGIYFYKLKSGQFNSVKKMMLVK